MKHRLLNLTSKVIAMTFVCTLFSATSQTQAMNLVAFGKACLKQESYLDRLKQRIDDAELAHRTDGNLHSGARSNLKTYNKQLSHLEGELQDCQGIAPNSPYCHETRMRYNRLTVMADRAKERIQKGREDEDHISPQKLFFQNQRYDEMNDQFIAMCRDSDTHYDLLRDPNAYSQVCSSPELKQSTTCSMF